MNVDCFYVYSSVTLIWTNRFTRVKVIFHHWHDHPFYGDLAIAIYKKQIAPQKHTAGNYAQFFEYFLENGCFINQVKRKSGRYSR